MSNLPLTEPEISKIAEQLGRMLLRLPIISGCVGHRKAEYTVRDYLRPQTPEAEFLMDVMSRPIPEVLLKWYPREERPDGTLFWWPDAAPKGGPGIEELERAYKAISKRGEKPAEYP